MSIDFTNPSTLRRFELVVEGKSLFVNPHYLAELSPYFLALCFDAGFAECQTGRVELCDVSYDDMIELLANVCPADDFTVQQRFSADNFALLTHLSNRLLLLSLRRELEQHAASDALVEGFLAEAPVPRIIEIAVEAVAAGFSENSVNAFCKLLARKDEAETTGLIASLPEEYKLALQPKVFEYMEYFRVTHVGCHRLGGTEHNHHHVPVCKRIFF